MAHNLNFNNGKYSFVSAKQVAWHSLGTVLDHVLTAEECILHANLDFEVIKVPNKAMYLDEYFDTDTYSTMRTDNKVVLGSKLGNRYTIVQNKEAFKFFDAIVGEGKAIYETAGCLNKGEVIFISAKLPESVLVGRDDLIDQYIMLTMAHDGSASIKAMITPIRVVCNNTLKAALANNISQVSIIHNGNALANLDKAHQILGIASKCINEQQVVYNCMANTKLSDFDKQATKLVAELFLKQEDYIIEGGKLEVITEISTRMTNIINGVHDSIYTGVGQNLATTKGTVFGLYNGITNYYQNVATYADNNSKKLQSLLTGSSKDMCDKAFEKCLMLID